MEVKLKILVRKKYLKKNYVGKSPIHFHAVQPNGVGTDIHATLTLAPVLKKHPNLRKPMVQHEIDEIRHWGGGNSGSHAHAKRREPKLTRELTIDTFWKKVK
jgi:hypothetical protein